MFKSNLGSESCSAFLPIITTFAARERVVFGKIGVRKLFRAAQPDEAGASATASSILRLPLTCFCLEHQEHFADLCLYSLPFTAMEYRPRYSQPFTLGEAIHLDVSVISEGLRAHPLCELPHANLE